MASATTTQNDEVATGRADRAALLEAATSAADVLAAHAARHDQAGTFPVEAIEAIWDAGLGNLSLPGIHDAATADLRTTAEVVALLGAGDASAALILVLHLVHLRLLLAEGSGAPATLQREVLASSLEGPALANALCATSDHALAGRVEASSGPAWSLSGRATCCTGASGLHWLFVWAGTADDHAGWFVARADAPGVSVEETWDHLGLRASASHDVVLEDVLVPLDHTFGLGPAGSAPQARDLVLAAWMDCLLLAVCRGAARAAADRLRRHQHERGAAMRELEGRLAMANRLCDGLARDLDAGGSRATAAAFSAPLVRAAVGRELVECVGATVALAGTAGLSRRHHIERHYRDVLSCHVALASPTPKGA